jgi:2-isopropylmalate synthase
MQRITDVKDRIIIFDTTLRDGEQSPGAALNIQEKLEIARQLEKLKVDVIEAGFPVSSPAQFEAVKRIAGEVNLVIAGLARAKELDIKTAYEAIREAQKKRIHTFIGTSDFHIMGKFADARYGHTLKEKRQTILKMACAAVQYAKTLCADVEFSAEDAGRTPLDYLNEVIEAAIEAGASTINIPDTTGYTLPSEFARKIKMIKEGVKNIDRVVISVHCHNDLGLAVANSLAAIEAGAGQVECTINGIGERAGNASLEEIVMALKVRKDLLKSDTGINTREIYNTSRMVSGFTGIVVQPNKAIVGENAFAHESGIHQDGMLKSRETYEIMTPDDVGINRTKIVLGRHSGRHGLKARLDELGYSLSDDELNTLYTRFTELADKKKEVFDDDLRLLMGDEILKTSSHYRLEQLQVNAGSHSIPTATVRIGTKDSVVQESSVGDGPVDAVFNAIDRAIKANYQVENYQVRSVTSGRQAMGEVQVRIRSGDQLYSGRGVSTDIIEASAKAYLQAINLHQLDQNTAAKKAK